MEIIMLGDGLSEVTFEVNLDVKKATLSGICLPANASESFEQILNDIQPLKDGQEFTFVFDLEYFNTGALGMIISLLQIFEQYSKNDCKIDILWYYKDDKDMEEAGYEFKVLVDLPFEVIQK